MSAGKIHDFPLISPVTVSRLRVIMKIYKVRKLKVAQRKRTRELDPMSTKAASKIHETAVIAPGARIGKDGPIVAVLATTENDPDALISLSKFTWTTPAKINLKRIAIQTASSCTVDKMEDLDRGYPIEFISTFSDADLDDM